MRLKNINGSYSPSFFNIFLETNEDISLAVQKNTQTFVHEFTHYLQDIVLPYNLRLNFTRLAMFVRIRESAKEHGFIDLPFNDWHDNERVLQEQLNYTMGNGALETGTGFVDIVSQIDSIQQYASDLVETEGRRFTLYTYSMPINDGEITYNLGARDLLEYIAYKIEEKQYQTSNVPDLPYKSIDLLFEYYGLSHVSDDIRLCIAEFCLYNDNPIHTLFTNFLANQYFKQSIEKNTYDQIHEMLLAYEFRTTDGINETLSDKFDRRLTQFVDILSDQYFVFSGIRDWILLVNSFVKNELTGKFIFTDMYRMNQDSFESFINNVIIKIGLPLVMNNMMACVTFRTLEIDTSQFIQFYILQEFLDSVLTSNNLCCPIQDFCVANSGKFNERCCLNPQARIMNQESCLNINFLKSYGLSNIDIK